MSPCSRGSYPMDPDSIQAMLDGHPDLIIFSLDLAYRYTGFNRRHAEEMQKVYGVTIEVGKCFLAFLTPPEVREDSKLNFDRAFSGETFSAIRVEPTTNAHYEVRWVPNRAEGGEVVGATAYVMNVTEREQLAESLRVQMDRMEQTLQTTMDGYILATLNAEILDVNPAYCAMMGYSRAELLQMRISDVEAELQPHEIEERVRRIKEKGRLRFETQHRTKDGRSLSLEVSVSVMEYGFGPMVAAFVRDMTERRRVESELRKLSVAVEQSPASVVITDLDGNIEYVNAKFTRLTGYRSEEVMGQNPRILQSGDSGPEDYREMWETLVAGKEWRGEFHNKKKDGDLYWEDASISPIFDREGNIAHFLAVKEDITERKEMEDRLRQSQKMEAVGQLAGGVAHDFNNLLTVINGYSDLMLASMDAGDPMFELVTEIADAGDRAASLTRQLLAFSRKQILQPCVLDVNELVDGMEKMLRRLIDESVLIRTCLASDLGQVKADPGQLEQVILNLALNARDAMPQGGVLTLSTRNVSRDEEPLTTGCCEGTCFVVIAVSDTGTGMSEDTQARIFEPFFTTKEVEKGTGLGLATVYGIVRQSGGDIRVNSDVGEGATFEVLLPCAQESAARPKSSMHEVESYGTETIVLVEDESAVRDLISASLTRYGYTVLTATDGIDAQEKFADFPGEIDLLLTDVIMPNMSGKQLAQVLSEKHPALNVLFMSGYTDDSFAAYGVLDEDTHFIQKPFSPQTLARKVRTVLG